jgi:ribosomal protein S18 acetylase RimI-like enzyme
MALPGQSTDLAEFLHDVDGYFGHRNVTIEFTEEPAVGDELRVAGWSDWEQTVYLAHVGEIHSGADAAIEPVDASSVEAFARTKLQSFDETEDEPDPAALAYEVSVRRAELRGDGRGLIASVEGQVAAMCAYYSGEDHFVFLLGTRIPCRGRGIASALLRRVLEDAREQNARSVVINTRAGGRPEALYRRLGFSDLVHQRWRFRQPS